MEFNNILSMMIITMGLFLGAMSAKEFFINHSVISGLLYMFVGLFFLMAGTSTMQGTPITKDTKEKEIEE